MDPLSVEECPAICIEIGDHPFTRRKANAHMLILNPFIKKGDVTLR
jgi:hypothetical protein